MDRVYLSCPYADKDAAKALGARFDPDRRAWYAPASRASAFARWIPGATGHDDSVLFGEDMTSEDVKHMVSAAGKDKTQMRLNWGGSLTRAGGAGSSGGDGGGEEKEDSKAGGGTEGVSAMADDDPYRDEGIDWSAVQTDGSNPSVLQSAAVAAEAEVRAGAGAGAGGAWGGAGQTARPALAGDMMTEADVTDMVVEAGRDRKQRKLVWGGAGLAATTAASRASRAGSEGKEGKEGKEG
jgi:hypothetical protein